jgi:hypothetical protein
VVSSAALTETSVALIHSGLEKESPIPTQRELDGGNSRNSPGENEIGTTIAIGASRNMLIATP